jgi:hypothetical protein
MHTNGTVQQHGFLSFWRSRQSLRAGCVSFQPRGHHSEFWRASPRSKSGPGPSPTPSNLIFFAKLRYHPTGNNTRIPRSKCCLRKRFAFALYSDSYLLEVMQQLMFVGLFTLFLLDFAICSPDFLK